MAPSNNLGAIGSGGPFAGFRDEDFDAYQRKKWRSNAFTLARREAKDRILALTRSVGEELSEELTELEVGASEEAPSVANSRQVKAQWVFFTRNADARAGLKRFLNKTDLMSGANLFDIAVNHQHACLIFRLDERGLSFGVELASKASVDLDNAAKKLGYQDARSDCLEILQNLPHGSELVWRDERTEASALTVEHLETLHSDLPAHSSTLKFEALLSRDEEILRSDALIGTAEEMFGSFIPLYRFLAWSPENDYAGIKVEIKRQKKKQAKQPTETATISAGSRVTILSGLFSGRAGYVAEIERGKAKVMVGPVSVTVD
ncbi:MAG: hypothetical protein AAF449_13230, partial [Myxococcota bacterium]